MDGWQKDVEDEEERRKKKDAIVLNKSQLWMEMFEQETGSYVLWVLADPVLQQSDW